MYILIFFQNVNGNNRVRRPGPGRTAGQTAVTGWPTATVRRRRRCQPRWCRANTEDTCRRRPRSCRHRRHRRLCRPRPANPGPSTNGPAASTNTATLACTAATTAVSATIRHRRPKSTTRTTRTLGKPEPNRPLTCCPWCWMLVLTNDNNNMFVRDAITILFLREGGGVDN